MTPSEDRAGQPCRQCRGGKYTLSTVSMRGAIPAVECTRCGHWTKRFYDPNNPADFIQLELPVKP